jgi:hypothetical protein
VVAKQTTTSTTTVETVSLLQQIFESQHSVEDWLAVSSRDESSSLKGVASASTNRDPRRNLSTNPKKMLWLHLACPTRIVQPKDGVCEAGSFSNLDDDLYLKTVKPAHTAFGVVSYDPHTDSTLLICRPYTGRTHQIRIHLQHLGHSIANDPNYGGDMWYANARGREACQMAHDRLNVVQTIRTMSTEINNRNDQNNIPSAAAAAATNSKDPVTTQPSEASAAVATTTTTMTTAIDVPATEQEILDGICTMVQGQEESMHDFVKRTCVWCARSNRVGGTDRAVLEFLIRSPGIWLHALQYSFKVVADHQDTIKEGEDVAAKSEIESVVDDKRSKIVTYRAPLPPWHTLSS